MTPTLISQPLHVLLVITKGDIGGAQTHVLEVCRALQHKVCFSAVIGGPAGSFLENGLTQLGIPTFSMPQLRNSLNPLGVLSSVRGLRSHLLEHPPHIIHAHSAVAGMVARLAGKLMHVPVVYTVHGFGFKPEAPPLIRFNAWLAEAVLAAWTTRMVCVSGFEKQMASRLPMDQDRVSVIPNAIKDAPWLSRQDVQPPAIVMVARMASPKRHDLLLQALALLAAKGLKPPVTLLGDGPLGASHRELASRLNLSHVRFAGDVLDVPEQLGKHSVFVLLSDHEGLPISLIEAMRAGMAIVASHLPGIQELVEDGQSALLVKNKPIDVAQALESLLPDAALRHRLGDSARARYVSRHQPDAMAASVLEVYQEAPLLPTATWPMTLPRRHNAALSSAHARQQHSHLWWAMLGLLLLAVLWLTGLWLEQQGWVTPVFERTFLASLVPYFLASQLMYRSTHLPAAERGGLLLVTTTVPFVLTPLGFALLQIPYSRGALLLSYLFTSGWFWLGYRWLLAPRSLKLLFWHEQQPQKLQGMLEAMGPSVARAAEQRLQLLPWPRHWLDKPWLCPDTLSVEGALTDSDDMRESHRRDILTQLKLHHIRLYSPQAVVEALSGRVPASVLESELWQPDGNPAYDLFKRLLDLAAVMITLPLWMPLGLLVALAVKLDSPGPAIFSQWRTGLHGRPFLIHKFRSMRHEKVDTPRFAGQDDPRITRLGAFLRKSRLDEIPQLWNVLRGDMSLIGPRPEQCAFVRQFAQSIPSYPYRHLVRPGVTGWAQVQQGYAAGHEETTVKLSYDLYYVTHYSLAMDLLILAKTLQTVVTGRGAR